MQYEHGGLGAMLKQLRNHKTRTVGLKQTIQAIQSGRVEQVFLAQDIDDYISNMVKTECDIAGLKINYIDTKEDIGEACGIAVGAATAATLKA